MSETCPLRMSSLANLTGRMFTPLQVNIEAVPLLASYLCVHSSALHVLFVVYGKRDEIASQTSERSLVHVIFATYDFIPLVISRDTMR